MKKLPILIATVVALMNVSCSQPKTGATASAPDAPVEVGAYTVNQIVDGVYHIQDFNHDNPAGETFDAEGNKTHFNNCSDLYLLTGEKEALLIDLSNNITWNDSAQQSLRQLVADRIGGLPLTITFTHNHGDHTGMLPAFANDSTVSFALPRIDFEALVERYPVAHYELYDAGKQFDLGGKTVSTVLVPGHTHGSMVFFLDGQDIAFSGDAIGSGHGVWIFNAEGFEELEIGVLNLINYIHDKGINTDRLTFYGGHYWQRDWFEDQIEGELINWQYLQDMNSLIAEIFDGMAQTEPSGLNHPVLDTYFRHGNAIVVWNKEQAKGVERP